MNAAMKSAIKWMREHGGDAAVARVKGGGRGERKQSYGSDEPRGNAGGWGDGSRGHAGGFTDDLDDDIPFVTNRGIW